MSEQNCNLSAVVFSSFIWSNAVSVRDLQPGLLEVFLRGTRTFMSLIQINSQPQASHSVFI